MIGNKIKYLKEMFVKNNVNNLGMYISVILCFVFVSVGVMKCYSWYVVIGMEVVMV